MSTLIVGPRPFEERDEAGIVHRFDLVAPPAVRLGELEATIGRECVMDGIRTTRVLERWLQPRGLELGLWSVTAMTVGGDDVDRFDQVTTPARRSASSRCGSTSTEASTSSRPSPVLAR